MNSTFTSNRKNYSRIICTAVFALFAMCGAMKAQLTGTKNIPGNYASLALAITDLNTQGVGAGGVTLNLIAGNPETAPAGGYLITAQGTSANTITINGNGNTITASAALTAGSLTDGIFKIVGGDYITIKQFVMQENPSNTVTTPASNNMTEWGVALLAQSTTNGAQSNTVQNNTISLDKNYSNSFAVYSNTRHSSASVTPTMSAANNTTAPNHSNTILSNIISNTNFAVVFCGAVSTTNMDNLTSIQSNTISNCAVSALGSSIGGVSTFTVAAVYLINQTNYAISNNTLSGMTFTTNNGSKCITTDYTTAPAGATSGTISGNNVSFNVASPGTNGSGIYLNSSTGLTGVTTNVTANTILNCDFGIGGNNLVGIYNTASVSVFNANSNIFRNNIVSGTGGFTGIQQSGAVSTSINLNENKFGDASGPAVTFTSATPGSGRFINNSLGGTATSLTIRKNDMKGMVYNSTSSSVVFFISNSYSMPSQKINANTFSGLNINTTADVYFIYNQTATVAGEILVADSNTVVGGFTKSAAGGSVFGYYTANVSSPAGSTKYIRHNDFSGITVTGSTVVYGIYDTDGATAGGPTRIVQNNIISNCTTTSSFYGLRLDKCGDNSVISNNTISTISSNGGGGIYFINNTPANQVIVSGNTVENITTSSTFYSISASMSGVTTAYITANNINGLNCASGSGWAFGIYTLSSMTMNISENKIANLFSSGYIVNGIFIGGGGTINAYNNTIGDLRSNYALSESVVGISIVNSPTAVNLYFNSIYLNQTTVPTTFGSSGISVSTTTNLTLRNNLVVNTSTPSGSAKTVAYRRASTTLTSYDAASDNNSFYAGTPSTSRLIFYDGTNSVQTITAYKTFVSPRDAASITANPTFSSTTASSPVFLHIPSGTAAGLESGGGVIAGITNDFDNDVRPGPVGSVNGGATAPDIGADEFDGSIACSGLNFDGVNDYVNVVSPTNIPTGNSNYTIEAWIKPDVFGIRGIIGWGNYGVTNQVNALRLDGSGAIINYWWFNDLVVNPANTFGGSPSITLTDGSWHHVVASYDGTTRKIYVDGYLKGQDTPTGHNVVGATNFRIGSTNNGEFFDGSVDEVRVWNRALCQSEIQNNKDCEIPGAYSGLVFNHHLNQGFANQNNAGVTTSPDASGNANNGTLTNFALTAAVSNWITPGGVVTGTSCGAFVPTAVTLSPVSQTNVSCFGGSNGAASITASGGTNFTYDWTPGTPAGDGTASITGLTAGTWTCTVTNNCGGGGTYTISITQPATPVSGTTVVTNVSCFGGSNGAINLTPSGGTGPYTYNWLPSGPTTEDRTGLVAGTYSVQVTDVNACVGTVTATVTQPSSPVSGTTVVTNVSCFGGSNGTINLTPSGGTGPYTYNWLPSGPTTEDRTGLVAGTYSVQITDVNGCVGTRTVTVTQPTSPVSGTTVVTNVACFGGSNGAINLTPTGGTGPYTFNWLPSGPTTEDRTGLVAGTYSVQITDVNSCVATVTATVTQPATPVSGTTVVTNVACFGGSNGAINLTPSGGTGPYTFNWLPSGPTTEDRTGLVAGTYSVQTTDVNGCTATTTVTVTQPTSPVSGTTVVTNVSCFGGSNGAINLTPSGGTGPYTYNWLPSGPTTEDRTGLVAGTYSVQTTDVNGCTGTTTVTVTQPATPVSGTTVVTNVACFGGSNGAINLTPTGGTGPYTYNWLPSGPTTEDRTGLVAGTYSVQVTDVNACVATVTATVTQPATPVSGTTVVTNVACFGGSNGVINLTPTGGTGPYTYNWLPSGPTTEDRTGLVAGTYSVQITDVNSCVATVTATVTQPATPVSGTTVVTNVACFGGSNGAINLTPSGGTGPYTYNWLPSGPTTEDRTGLVAGTYSVQTTDVNGCVATVTATVTQPATPVSGTTVVTNVACFGGSNGAINLTPSGGTGPYTFNWLPSGPTTEDRTGLVAGTYSVQVTDVNACVATVTATVTQPATPVSGTTVVTNVACFGGSNGAINLTPSGGTGPYTFNWLPSGPTTEDRTGLVAGTYSVQTTDVNGCTGTTTVTVTQPATPVSGTTVVTNVACFGGSNGAINLTPSGGTGPYTFNWLPSGPTTEDRTALVAGTYSVQTTDVNGCTGTTTVTVTQPTSPVSGTTVVTNIACFGGSNGAINFTPSGGTSPYTFSWGGGITTEDRTGLAAGNYTVVTTDANACTGTTTVTVTQPTSPVSGTTVVTNVACFGGSNGAINLTPSGGTPGYTFNWGGGITTEDRTGLVGGTYSVSITDNNGCTGSVSATVTQPTSPVSGTTAVTNVSCFGGSNGAINFSPSGGTPPYTFNWGAGVTTEDRTGMVAGTYTVITTDANGCTGTTTVTVTQPSAISASVTSNNVACNAGTNGDATVSASGGTGTLSYLWNDVAAQTTATASNLAAGNYTVTITDANSCSATQTVTITEPTAISASVTSNNVACNAGTNGDATVTANGGTGTLSYLWNDALAQTTATATNLSAGNYTVTITDVNSCSATQTVTITEPSAISASVTSNNVTCNAGANGDATVSASGGTGILSYLWNDALAQTTATATNLSAGNYTVTITDANSCSATQMVTITEPSAISASVTSNNVTCNAGANGDATVSASGGTGTLSYLWNDALAQTTATATNLSAGNYTVTITDANSCSATQTVTITEPAAISAGITSTDVSCNAGTNGDATVSASGGTGILSYLWSDALAQTTATATNLSAGNYTVTITDASSCSATQTVTITEPATISASITSTDVTCNAGANGDATVTASGGTGTLSYLWNDATAQTTATATNLSAGNYTVTITDANSCSTTQIVTITEPTAITVNTSSTSSPGCGMSDGSITVNVSGGTGTFSYAWSSGGTNATESGLAAGNYTVTVTDANNCSAQHVEGLSNPGAPVVSGSVTANAGCAGQSNGSIDLTVTAGTTYTVLWSNSSANEDLNNLSAGNYAVTITDANNCAATDNFTVTEFALPNVTLNIISADTICSADAGFTLAGETPAGGTWAGTGVTGSTFDPVNANLGWNIITYSYTDGNSCSNSANDSVFVDACLGIKNIPSELSVELYPNPTKNTINIRINNDKAQLITVMDAAGKLLQNFAPSSTDVIMIDFSNYEEGVYFIRIQTTGKVITRSVVKH
jgi:hypothetical protein